jgi:glycine cleavage system P protein (glycine dehydrogenase) subunit 1
MSYSPHTKEDRQIMLAEIGAGSIEDLISDISLELRKHSIELPEAVSETELLREIEQYTEKNIIPTAKRVSFIGGGSYHHFIPAVVPELAMRSEFYTAYTPYQPEVSQGTLTAIYEFQTMICNLTGMDIANASMYDGATAAAEAGILAANFTKRNEIIVLNDVNPNYQEVMKTYFSGREITIENSALKDLNVTENTAAVIIQNPTFFGDIIDLNSAAEKIHEKGALFIMIVDPLSLGLLRSPGELGADIIVGEGQCLGISPSLGGPGLGLFAVKQKYQRFMPGRIVGQTNDVDGNKGFVLTLQTREQHIRREKATSNICSNQALCALMATIYLSYMGPQGLKELAQLNININNYAKEQLSGLAGFKVLNEAPTFKEFVLECPKEAKVINNHLLSKGIIGGFNLGKIDPKMKNQILICTTELTLKSDIDELVSELRDI